MTFRLYAVVSCLGASFAHMLIGSLKLFLLRSFSLILSVCHLHLEYLSYDESDESDEPGSESGSDGTFHTRLVGLLSGVGFYFRVVLSAYE